MIRIEKRNNQSRIYLVIVILILALYFSTRFLLNPSQHTYWLLPSEKSVIIFSIIGIFISITTIIIIIKQIFNKNAYILINHEGIYYGFYLYKNKFIYWKDINDIKIIKYNFNKYLAIYVKDISKYEKIESGVTRLIFKMNMNTNETPFLMYTKHINLSFDDFYKTLVKEWEEYKKSLKQR